jgi:hypothetical protein
MASKTIVQSGALTSTATWTDAAAPATSGDTLVLGSFNLLVDRTTTFSGISSGSANATLSVTPNVALKFVAPFSYSGTGSISIKRIGAVENTTGTSAGYVTKGV